MLAQPSDIARILEWLFFSGDIYYMLFRLEMAYLRCHTSAKFLLHKCINMGRKYIKSKKIFTQQQLHALTRSLPPDACYIYLYATLDLLWQVINEIECTSASAASAASATDVHLRQA